MPLTYNHSHELSKQEGAVVEGTQSVVEKEGGVSVDDKNTKSASTFDMFAENASLPESGVR